MCLSSGQIQKMAYVAPMTSRNHGKAITYLFGLLAAGAAILVGVSYYFSTSSIHQLLSDNRDLKVAIET